MVAIAVYCASAEGIDPWYTGLATQVGTELAARGHSLVTGGGRVSMMGAVAQAARAGGAHTLGVIPEALRYREDADLECDELIFTATMRERKAHMDDRADAFLALPGGIGTLEELFEVWTSGTHAMHDKPVVVLDPEGYYAPLLEWIGQLVKDGFVRESALRRLRIVTTVADALDACEDALEARTG
jgi:uncharacterized protein (TIGR00730 family)